MARARVLELLSTTLWHLKDEVELCYLAQRVSEFDKHAPQVVSLATDGLRRRDVSSRADGRSLFV